MPLSVAFPIPVSPFDTYVSLVDGGPADLHVALTLNAYDLNTGHVQIGLTLKPLPGRTVADMQFRLLLWLADDLLHTNVQGNTTAPDDQNYVALGYSTNGVQPMSPQVNFLLDQITQAHDGVRCNHYTINASTPGHPDPMNVTGGMVTGPQVVLSGVATTYDIISHAYTEPPTPLRGIDLSRALPSPSASATSPASGVWADVGIANTGTTDTRFRFDIYLPSTPDGPTTEPQWELDPAASTLRAGTYEYAVTFKAHSGNETGATCDRPRAGARDRQPFGEAHVDPRRAGEHRRLRQGRLAGHLPDRGERGPIPAVTWSRSARSPAPPVAPSRTPGPNPRRARPRRRRRPSCSRGWSSGSPPCARSTSTAPWP